MFETITRWFDMRDPTQPARDEGLLIGTAVFLVGFYVLSTLWVLFDRTGGSDEQNEAPTFITSEGFYQRWIGIFSAFILFLLIIGFPWFYQRGWHGWVIFPVFLLTLVAFSESRAKRLRLRIPRRLNRNEAIGLFFLCLFVLGLTLFRWEHAPVAMNGDEASIGVSGKGLWVHHYHPFRVNASTLPAVLDTLYGLCVIFFEDPRFGLRVYPLFCAVLCPLVLFRWIRLFGPPPLAWMSTFLFVITPFFQYYSRVPMGTTLIFAELVFFYGFTRCLVSRGISGPIAGGIALGVAHWDYYAARVLIGLSITLPFLALAFCGREKLAKGWWWRVILLGVIALPFVFSFLLMADYDPSRWTWYMAPGYFTFENSDLARGFGSLWPKVIGHFEMWFSDAGNEARFMTVPGSPVLPYPLGGLALAGFGVLLFSFTTCLAPTLIWTFILGVACSLFSMGSPNGHRAMVACVPIAVFMGMGLYAVWPVHLNGDAPIRDRIRASMVGILLVLGTIISLKYFHVDMWKDPRAIIAHHYAMNDRTQRLLRDRDDYDLQVAPFPNDIDRLLLDIERDDIGTFHYGTWLPPNWAERPMSVQADTHVKSLVGLPRSVFGEESFEVLFDPMGGFSGWGYHTGREKLSLKEAARRWYEEGRLGGSIMVPESGTLAISCKDCRIFNQSPTLPQESVGRGTMQVLRGLNRIILEPTQPDQRLPLYLKIDYSPFEGAGYEGTLSVTDLYAIPFRGWFKTVHEARIVNGTEVVTKAQSISPVIFTHHTAEDPPIGGAT